MAPAAVGQLRRADRPRRVLIRYNVVDEGSSFGVESMQQLGRCDSNNDGAGVGFQLLAVEECCANVIKW